MNSDFTSKDTSLWLSGICIVLMVLMKSSVDCSLRLDSSVKGFSMVVKYLESSYVGDPQNETMGRIGMLCLCSFGCPYSFGGCGTEHLSRKYCGLLMASFCLSDLTLTMTTAQVVEMSVTNNSLSKGYPHPEDHDKPIYLVCWLCSVHLFIVMCICLQQHFPFL